MKPRETRRKVLIRARMRGPDGWHDACILNLSSRGMMLQAAAPAERGSYVEIRRGAHVIVGRVAWRHKHRFGVRSQDALSVDALVHDADAAVARPTGRPAGQERRILARPPERRHQHSRERARAMEFAGLILMSACAASFAYGAVGEALAQPMQNISAVFAPQ